MSAILLSKGGRTMLDKLCISERRARIIDYLIVNKQSTYIELAAEFNVTVGTIGRDIEYLSTVAPIYTKQGNHGGVYILPEYRSHRYYLSDSEEVCLCRLMKTASSDECKILRGIIAKFTKGRG